MTIEDIKNILNNKILNNIDLKYNNPSRIKKNKYILNLFIKNYNNFTKTELIYLLKNKNNLENLHIFCPVCGKKNVFHNLKKGYSLYCGSLHANQSSREKAKQTWNEKYGVDNPNKCKEIRNKIKQTCKQRFGVEHNWSSKDPKLNGKATCKERYGVDNPFKSKDPKLNGRATCKERYGNEIFSKTNIYKDKYKDREFVKHKQQKQYEARKKNGTFNTSKSEDIIYQKLLNIFSDTIHHYKDDRYPFECDFYIPSKDLFIELNFHWTHGFKPFNKDDNQCIEKLNNWQEKSINSKFYKNAIYCWTDLDIRKLKVFKKNNLNYKIFYSEKEFDGWFQSF